MALSRTAAARVPLPLLVALAGATIAAGPATAAAAKTVGYRGYRAVVPASWPVYRLATNPTTCVRFDRHAVYLGSPSSRQRCPTTAVGRTEAILVAPLGAAGAAGSVMRLTAASAQPRGGSIAQLRIPAQGVLVTATWGSHVGLVRRALRDRSIGVRSAAAGRGARLTTEARRFSGAALATEQRIKGRAAGGASIYTGRGFDACSAPSASTLSAWSASPFRALGVYIGGANMACSQANLTASYVSAEVAAGWHFIPTYVGLQAPSNSCGCAAIAPGRAGAQGTAAAQDAVTQAQAVGIAPGNPIYFDMEGYRRGGVNSSTVLSFLQAWTEQLHAEGYLSGVYSSTDSGVRDLVSQAGSGYVEPDELWNANWNGSRSTADAAIPSGDWAAHQRVHQYRGGHDETYGNATINIDSDYVDGATVGPASVTPPASPPASTTVPPASAPSLSATPKPRGTIALDASWTGAGGVVGWRLLGGYSPAALIPLTGARASGSIVSHSALPYFRAQALGAGGQLLGSTPAIATPPHLTIYGASAFVASGGLAGLPVGCYAHVACRLTTKVHAGATQIAFTGVERVAAQRNGIVYFRLNGAGRSAIAHAKGRRLAVRVTVGDASSGKSTTSWLVLVPFTTSGAVPRRAVSQSATLKLVGTSDFVSSAGTGGILAGCYAATPCRISATLTAAGATIATTGSETIGAGEPGYVIFRLSPHGRALLRAATGNQLAAQVKLTGGTGGAGARIALIGFR